MRTRLFGLFAGFLAILVGTPTSASAQGSFSVLVNGFIPAGSPNFIYDYVGPAQLNEMKISPGFGGEVRFGQNGRATFGLGYHSWRASSSSSSATDKARANEVTGALYINLVKKGPVRPFLGGGGGVAMVKNDHTENEDAYWNRVFYPAGTKYESSAVVPTIRGLGGVNIYPAKHVILSLGGGYINGPALNVGVGVTF